MENMEVEHGPVEDCFLLRTICIHYSTSMNDCLREGKETGRLGDLPIPPNSVLKGFLSNPVPIGPIGLGVRDVIDGSWANWAN